MVPTGEFGVVPANKIIAAIGNKPELPIVKALGVDANDDATSPSRTCPTA